MRITIFGAIYAMYFFYCSHAIYFKYLDIFYLNTKKKTLNLCSYKTNPFTPTLHIVCNYMWVFAGVVLCVVLRRVYYRIDANTSQNNKKGMH